MEYNNTLPINSRRTTSVLEILTGGSCGASVGLFAVGLQNTITNHAGTTDFSGLYLIAGAFLAVSVAAHYYLAMRQT